MSNKDFVTRIKEEYRDSRDWKYIELSDSGNGASSDMWVPDTGKKLKVSEIIISVTGGGKLILTLGTRILCHLEFDKRSTLPIELVFDIEGNVNEKLSGTWTADSAPADCYITVFGEEVG